MIASDIITAYISFFEKKGHKRIPNAPLVPENDPTTLFTSSGMQPLVPYLLGEQHPLGTRLVNVQNCFRAQDIDEIGDNRHTTFFRMLGNWSLGDYFKQEQLPWVFEFLTKSLEIDPKRLYVTVFEGNKEVAKDEEAVNIWTELFTKVGLNPKERIFYYGVDKNWWSRSGVPKNMPPGEPGGPDSEVFYEFDVEHKPEFGEKCHVNCDCGRFIEIGNSVFMEYQKQQDGSFKKLPQQNVDFGGGLERLVMATEHQQDIFVTSLFHPIITTIENVTKTSYKEHSRAMRIVADHLVAATFMANAHIKPSKTEQGYILRRLIRRSYDNINVLRGIDDMNLRTKEIISSIVEQYKTTDPVLEENYEEIENTILEEANNYRSTLNNAKQYIEKKHKEYTQAGGNVQVTGDWISGAINDPNTDIHRKTFGDEIVGGKKEISAEDAFVLYSTHGLSPTQIKSLGYTFDKQAFAQKMEEHQSLSRKGAAQKFAGGLADHQERTIMGHTATHLLQQALRDVLGNHVFQTGSNITTERLRFDFSHEQKLTDEEIKKVEKIVNEKIKENLPVYYLLLPLKKAKELGAIGLFDEKYQEQVKVYCMGSDPQHPEKAYSKEFCGGPHVPETSKVISFKITKQENIGNKQRRVYATVG